MTRRVLWAIAFAFALRRFIDTLEDAADALDWNAAPR